MIFLNPLALLGLLAAGIPIVIHFINQRKKRLVHFSSIALLKELQSSSLRTLHIQQWLLLALRVLAILLLVSAFARPALRFSFAGIGARSAGSTVIILDNTFSMELSDERGTRFKQAQQVALHILRSLDNGDEASLLFLADINDTRFARPTRDITTLMQAVENARIGFDMPDMQAALRVSAGVLAQARTVNKEVFVITDAQKNILSPHTQQNLTDTSQHSPIEASHILDETTELFLLPIGLQSTADAKNLSIDSLRIISSLFQPNKPVEFEAWIKNHGNQPAENIVLNVSMNGERRAQRSLRIEAGQIRAVPISAEPQTTGLIRCAVSIDNDVLPTDNTRHAGIIVPEHINIALIGERADTEFLEIALTADASSDASTTSFIRHRVQTIPTAALSASDLQRYDALICANITAFSQSDIVRLQEYCKQGGGIVVFAGDKSNVPSYNATFLPAFGFGEWITKKYSPATPAHITTVEYAHPLMKDIFVRSTEQVAGSSDLVRTTLLPESPDIAQCLLSTERGILGTDDGGIMSERIVGKGRVIVCGLPASTAWSTFPLTGLFAALTYRLPSYVSMSGNTSISTYTGQPLSINIGAKYVGIQSVLLQEPSGGISTRKPLALPSGTVLRFDGFSQTGVYGITTPQSQPLLTIAVNHSAQESLHDRWSSSELRTVFAQYVPSGITPRVITPDDQFDITTQRQRSGTELWQVCVFLAFCIAVTEMLYARSIAQRTIA